MPRKGNTASGMPRDQALSAATTSTFCCGRHEWFETSTIWPGSTCSAFSPGRSVELPFPPRAISSAFTSATMRAMAASSAAFVILAARALAMLSLSRAAPLLRRKARFLLENPTTDYPGELSGGPHPIYLHLLDSRGLVLVADLKSY